jgi:hypothetical protein
MPVVPILIVNVLWLIVIIAFWWAFIGLFTGRFYLFSRSIIQGKSARLANAVAMAAFFLADCLLLWWFFTLVSGK